MQRTYALKTPQILNKQVLLKGWVDRIRDHGGVLFIDLRDSSGKVQIVANPENKESYEIAQKLGNEYVIAAEGEVINRAPEAVNPNMPTGTIEVVLSKITLLNAAKPLPFPINDDGYGIDENVRLKYRYVDLRRERLQNMLKMKHKIILFIRNWMDRNGFVEIQTPILTASSPEGARDYLVPSRIHPGKFYALPQAPQMYKQLLMVAGIDKYFQIAPCFRDEDPRADRHSGDFYQIDVENAFVTQEEFFTRMEPFFKELVETLTDKKLMTFPFPRLTYKEAMQSYGIDKPDLRFGIKIQDVTDVAHRSSMNIFQKAPVVKALVLPGYGKKSRKEIDDLIEFAKSLGAPGLAWIKIADNLTFEGPIAKFFDEALQSELRSAVTPEEALSEGDLIVFAADKEPSALELLGKIRLRVRDELKLADNNIIAFAWVTDFPMFEWKADEKKWDFMHNPFSMPQGGMEALQTKKPDEILAYQYDIVANNLELSSGSIRNHEPETLIKAFEIVGYTREEVQDKFGHMLEAFQHGAPPHGGFAPGLDRILMLLLDEPNIRDVYAFPKNGKAQDVMMNAPREVDAKTLRELNIKVIE
ncbi:MAG: aspartate--tRNA ligase [bacterium]